MTAPYDPSTPSDWTSDQKLRADATDDDLHARWAVSGHSREHIAREFAAAQVAAAVSRCLAIAKEEAAAWRDNETGDIAVTAGAEEAAERIAARIEREVQP